MEEFEIDPLGPHEGAGVYAVILMHYPHRAAPDRIVYIGSSRNIHKRVMNTSHPYRKLYTRLSRSFLVCIGNYPTNDFLSEEIRLIKKYRPWLNKTHKNG